MFLSLKFKRDTRAQDLSLIINQPTIKIIQQIIKNHSSDRKRQLQSLIQRHLTQNKSQNIRHSFFPNTYYGGTNIDTQIYTYLHFFLSENDLNLLRMKTLEF